MKNEEWLALLRFLLLILAYIRWLWGCRQPRTAGLWCGWVMKKKDEG